MESYPAQDSADGGRRNADGPNNLAPRLALEVYRHNVGGSGRRPGLSMHPRIAADQAVRALGLIPGDPLAHATRPPPRGGGNEAHGQVVVEHTCNQLARLAGVGTG